MVNRKFFHLVSVIFILVFFSFSFIVSSLQIDKSSQVDFDRGYYISSYYNSTFGGVVFSSPTSYNYTQKQFPDNKGLDQISYRNLSMVGNVLLFHFNEVNASNQTVVVDYSGSGSNGTLFTNFPSDLVNVSGFLGGGFYFDVNDSSTNVTNIGGYYYPDRFVSGSYVEVPHNSSVVSSINDQVSVVAFVNVGAFNITGGGVSGKTPLSQSLVTKAYGSLSNNSDDETIDFRLGFSAGSSPVTSTAGVVNYDPLYAPGRVPFFKISTISGFFRVAGATSFLGGSAAQVYGETGWGCLAATYNGSGNGEANLYINGELQKRVTGQGSGPIQNTINSTIRIGNWADEIFRGKVDEVAVFNRTLSQREIYLLCNSVLGTFENQSVYVSEVFDANYSSNWKNILLGLTNFSNKKELPNDQNESAWVNMSGNILLAHFDEPIASVEDSAGIYDGIGIFGADTVSNGKFGRAASFDGLDDCISIPTALNGKNNGSIALWVNYTELGSFPGGEWLFSSSSPIAGYNSNQTSFGLYTSLNGSDFRLGNNQYSSSNYNNLTYVSSSVIPSLNEWYFVVGTWGNGVYSIYVNGEKKGSINFSASYPQIYLLGRYTHIGCSNFNGTSINGLIDEVSLWDRPLTDQEIINLNNSVSSLNGNEFGLVSLYKFEEESYIPNTDSSNSSTVESYLSSEALPFYSAGYLNGSFVSYPYYATNYIYSWSKLRYDNLDLNYSESFTFSVWVKNYGSREPNAHLFEISENGLCNSNPIIFSNTSSKINLVSCGTGIYSPIASVSDFDSWKMLTIVFNGSTNFIYLNGSLVNTLEYVWPSSSNLSLSVASAFNGSRNYGMFVDELSLWNRALNSSEVLLIYENQKNNNSLDVLSYRFCTFENCESSAASINEYGASFISLSESSLANFLIPDFYRSYNPFDIDNAKRYIQFKFTFANNSENILKNFSLGYLDRSKPVLNNISFGEFNDWDPLNSIELIANISDYGGINNTNIDSVLFYYNNGTQWYNKTMSLKSSGIYNTSLTFDSQEKNYSAYVFFNDSSGNTNGLPFYISSFWDCTWDVSPSSFDSVVGFFEQKDLGNITIRNNGDNNYSVNNCTITFTIDKDFSDSTFSEDYFTYGITSFGVYPQGVLTLNSSNLAQFVESFNLPAKRNMTLVARATFPSSIYPLDEHPKINVNSSISDSNSGNTSFNVSARMIISLPGPYLSQEIVEPDNNELIYLTNQTFYVTSTLENVPGNGSEINTAYNVSSIYGLPSLFSSILSSGSEEYFYSSISDDSLQYTTLGFDLTIDNLPSILPGIYSVNLTSFGYKNSSGNLSLISHAGNNTNLSSSINFILACYSQEDEICVDACGYLLDPDCSEPSTGGSSSGGGGGGGGGGGAGSLEVKTEATFELVRGEKTSFQLPITNTYPNAKKNVTIKVKGVEERHVEISPIVLETIPANSSRNITVTLTAPSYFSQNASILEFEISGLVSTGNATYSFKETKFVKLIILEFSREQALKYLNSAESLIKNMNDSNFQIKEVNKLYSDMEKYYSSYEYLKLKENFDLLDKIQSAAFESKDLIEELKKAVSEAQKRGILVLDTQKLLFTAESIFERGDYVSALEKLKQAKTAYALETKGEFNLFYEIKNNPIQFFALLIGLGLFGVGSSFGIKYKYYKSRAKLLDDEARLIVQLMKVVQKQCFEEGKMSMEEYREAMYQYEKRLSSSIQERVNAETKIANLLKFNAEKLALSDERERLIGLIRGLQIDYLKNAKVDTRIYENMLKIYSARLGKVEEELSFIEAKSFLKNNKISEIKDFDDNQPLNDEKVLPNKKIDSLLEKGYNFVKSKNFEKARDVYAEIKDEYSSLDPSNKSKDLYLKIKDYYDAVSKMLN